MWWTLVKFYAKKYWYLIVLIGMCVAGFFIFLATRNSGVFQNIIASYTKKVAESVKNKDAELKKNDNKIKENEDVIIDLDSDNKDIQKEKDNVDVDTAKKKEKLKDANEDELEKNIRSKI